LKKENINIYIREKERERERDIIFPSSFSSRCMYNDSDATEIITQLD